MGTDANTGSKEDEKQLSPVYDENIDDDLPGGVASQKLQPGAALCLSGGGYRAMLFHVGALWRLHEVDLLRSMKRISSVSGGSITAGVLALNWRKLSSEPAQISQDFVEHVVAPIRNIASCTIDEGAILGGLLMPGMIADRIAEAFRKYLFGNATLQDLPENPRFIINATNVQSGALWRFSKPYMADWRVGKAPNPTVELAVAVAASSAYPPMLSPLVMEVDPRAFEPASGRDLQKEPFISRVVLSDGGVYDNLGLETAWKKYDTIFVSDAGGKMQPEAEPKEDWARHCKRILDVIDNQVRAMRKRQVIGSYKDGLRRGCYWGIRTNIADYELADPLDCPFDRTMALANIPTRFKGMSAILQERLINWGYAVCDAAIRRHHAPSVSCSPRFPYPNSSIVTG